MGGSFRVDAYLCRTPAIPSQLQGLMVRLAGGDGGSGRGRGCGCTQNTVSLCHSITISIFF